MPTLPQGCAVANGSSGESSAGLRCPRAVRSGRSSTRSSPACASCRSPSGPRCSCELAGHSYQEIATLLGSDEEAVRGLIARARTGLRAHREAAETPCATVPAALAAEPDGRRHDRTIRRHLRTCTACRAYRQALRSDTRALRGLAPMPASGMAGGGALFGLVAKGALTGGAISQMGAACAVTVCSVGGIVLLYPHPSTRARIRLLRGGWGPCPSGPGAGERSPAAWPRPRSVTWAWAPLVRRSARRRSWW